MVVLHICLLHLNVVLLFCALLFVVVLFRTFILYDILWNIHFSIFIWAASQ